MIVFYINTHNSHMDVNTGVPTNCRKQLLGIAIGNEWTENSCRIFTHMTSLRMRSAKYLPCSVTLFPSIRLEARMVSIASSILSTSGASPPSHLLSRMERMRSISSPTIWLSHRPLAFTPAISSRPVRLTPSPSALPN